MHVFDRATVATLMSELDTVTDFVAYLGAKEEFLGRAQVLLEGEEWDLLAVYLREDRKFPSEASVLHLTAGLWDQVLTEPEFQRRKAADQISYAWDNLIEQFAGHATGGTLLGNAPLEHTERGLRYMVLEKRFHRRLLGEAFIGFLHKAANGTAGSRTVSSPSGVVYVFVVCPRSFSPDERGYLLRAYCAILLDDNPAAQAVVGILTERPDDEWGASYLMMLYENPITDEVREYAADGRDMGVLRRQVQHPFHAKEFPDAE